MTQVKTLLVFQIQAIKFRRNNMEELIPATPLDL